MRCQKAYSRGWELSFLEEKLLYLSHKEKIHTKKGEEDDKEFHVFEHPQMTDIARGTPPIQHRDTTFPWVWGDGIWSWKVV